MHISVARVTTPPTTPPSGAHDPRGLSGKAALVAGGTRGAGRGNAVQLGTAGATVYVTGRTSGSERSERSEPPETDRPETIEETAALVHEASGHGIPSRWTTSYLRRSAH